MAASQYSRGLGHPDPANMIMQDLFASRYRGKRYSFGYPDCPSLDDLQRIRRADGRHDDETGGACQCADVSGSC